MKLEDSFDQKKNQNLGYIYIIIALKSADYFKLNRIWFRLKRFFC